MESTFHDIYDTEVCDFFLFISTDGDEKTISFLFFQWLFINDIFLLQETILYRTE